MTTEKLSPKEVRGQMERLRAQNKELNLVYDAIGKDIHLVQEQICSIQQDRCPHENTEVHTITEGFTSCKDCGKGWIAKKK